MRWELKEGMCKVGAVVSVLLEAGWIGSIHHNVDTYVLLDVRTWKMLKS